MRVKCIANTGSALSSATRETGYFDTTEFQLAIGAVYTVYGISLWQGVLHYLTMDKYETLPFWHPAELFRVDDSSLPLEWHCQFFGADPELALHAIWGYKELVTEEDHYDDLMEREEEAIRIFLKRKQEIDETIE